MPNLDTIDYDRPVKNLIAGLNATGHITHGPYRKTMVTVHHNGGGPGFTPEDILNIWKTRPASAHFDVDANGDVAQFANCYDYAWACANTYGNQTSISIEMANSSLYPDWNVSITTWRSTARLVGWLFAHIIHGSPRPHRSNLVYHHHWASTACAGPYMDSVYDEFLDAAQQAYDTFKDGKTPPVHKPDPPKRHKPKHHKLAEDGDFGIASTKALQRRAGTTVDGVISSQAATEKPFHPNLYTCQYVAVSRANGSQVIAWVQRHLGVKSDGLCGPGTIRAIQRHVGVKADGYFGPKTARAVQHALNSDTF